MENPQAPGRVAGRSWHSLGQGEGRGELGSLGWRQPLAVPPTPRCPPEKGGQCGVQEVLWEWGRGWLLAPGLCQQQGM